MCLISIMINLSGLYNFKSNIPISMDYYFKSEYMFYLIYKCWIVIHHSDDIWDCLSITRYSFPSFGNRYRHILDRWRERLMLLTTIYAINVFLEVTIDFVIISKFSEEITAFKNYDGSIRYYSQTAMNFYFIVSDETYNSKYYTFLFIEVLYIYLFVILFCIFDILLLTQLHHAFSMNYQMQINCSAFESTGHKSHSLIGEYNIIEVHKFDG